MPNYESTITNFVIGDDFTIERTVTAVPSGQTLTNAWFTVKRKFSDLDAVAIIQKAITPSLVADVGHIDDTGADGTGHLIFFLTDTETLRLTPLSEYRFDIQVKLSNGAISTPEVGIIVAFPHVTITT